ncbi:MAG: PASTA domain-containing protein [Clostridia bacterium]|nr:PASTA domain-containing protein [Clostridia bacterium]
MKTRFKTFYNISSLQKRFIAIIMSIIVIFFALLTRVFYLQIINGKNLQIKASEQWLRDLPLSSKRGEILDCNGVSLATTITTYDVYVRARNVTNPSELASGIKELLGIDYDKAYEKVTNKSFSEILIKMQVEESKAKALTKYDGIYLSQNVARVYPYDNLLTQVLGYCTIDNIGQAGLESYYDKYLKGIDGKSLTQTNARGEEIENSLGYYIPSVAGANLNTTIDVQMQSILERELKVAYDEHEALGVTGLILDAKTGGIKAMSCLPSFNLNEIPRDDISSLQAMTKNSTVVDVYEPGSTFKLITLAAALNEGLTHTEEHFYCGGRTTVDGETIKCWKSVGHGSQTLVEGFKNSCNCVFVNLALRLGVDKYYEYLNLFGLGQKTGVDIASESSGIIMPKEQVRNVDLARIGFGHAIAVTQLQMATVYSKITTGYDITPHIMQSIETEDRVLYETQNTQKEINLSPDTISTINNMLANNINSEGNYTFVAGYDIGGKTGTAQKYGEDGKIATGKYISSFIGTYPANNPEYVMVICVNEPSTGAYYGGVVAKPIGERVFSSIFETKGIAPTDASQLTNQPNILMPYLVGKSLSEACAELKKLGLNVIFDGDGEYVIMQLPPENTALYIGEIVYLIVG